MASVRHTAGFLLASLLLAIWGAFDSPIYEWPTTLASQHARLLFYVQILALQWLWVGYVWFGMRHSAISLRAVIDDSQASGWRWLRYLAIGVAGWILYLALGAGLSNVLSSEP